MMKDIPPRYQVDKMLGSGAFGFVYSALDLTNNQKVAIKRIEKVGKQLSREYEVLVELKDTQHCVRMVDCFFTRNVQKTLVQNMVLEFLEDDLEKVIRVYREKGMFLPEHKIKLYAYQIFKGLEEMHQKNITHRDLKPENILRSIDDVVKVADFGSSKFIEPKSQNTPYIVSRYYRAPELLLCMTSYNHKIDIWAAGCIIAELVTRQPLFKGKTEGDQLFCIMCYLGSLSQADVDFFSKQFPHLEKYFDKIPSYRKDEERLSELYNFFSEPNVARNFFEHVFKYNPTNRISATEALNHRFFADTKPAYEAHMRKLGLGSS